jgi:hypothetical protein
MFADGDRLLERALVKRLPIDGRRTRRIRLSQDNV